ncbi:neutral zinc metallopeptidase [Subtercola boreus]|uniref:Neutral zinc metallopeptidase n=1 Tax=Subtercola boreus TaxID=120213 RepID=A0A3E0W3P6_9MICO|nr:neutral zinc metallopeptidase [Subtercola boreus]RFA16369.1 neutral zinc metallopeptidase [Subtercola boreus]
MTFNDNSKLDTSRVSKRGKTGIALGGGGAVVVIGLFLLSQVLGVDLTGLAGGATSQGSSSAEALDCQTGADANARVDCLMVGASNSLDAYWTAEAPRLGVSYRSPAEFVLFDGGIGTGCGQATSATGPFYCPADQRVYVDTSFFDELRTRFGATGGTLSEMYVVAHEWGHHIQQLEGTFAGTDRNATGAGSDSVRTELQADCYAGAWAASASQITDENGVAFIQPITEAQIADALNAAAAIGDDRIQQQSTSSVNPESFTHGSGDQRERWFTNGYSGGAGNCDTFAAGAL